MPYHHGDLRRALMDTALDAVTEVGPAALSLRDVARRAGVSHAAPTHHFGDKAGLLTALATEGWSLLADALATARAAGSTEQGFAEQGVAYVVFATGHPGHFAVMRAVGLDRVADAELRAATERAATELQAGAGSRGGDATTELAGWAMVHGLSVLLLEGAVSTDDVAGLARGVTAQLRPDAATSPGTTAPTPAADRSSSP